MVDKSRITSRWPTVIARWKAFGSTRAPAAINDWHVFEVAKDAKGRVSLKTVATPLKDHQDAYHAQCAMQ